jgi:4-hydroxybenzoate polyprenyltransferase
MRLAFSLLKPRYHLSYTTVVAAALLFARAPDGALAARLLALYLAFNVLLYGGIYIANDVADARADAAHRHKHSRPIPSGQLSMQTAVLSAAGLIASGLLAVALLFPPGVMVASCAALILNAAYSAGGRNVPYLDVALNSAPHAVRFLMGVLLVGQTPPAGHLVAWFCLAAGIACVRRLVELEAGGESNRPTLRHYSTRGLSLAADLGIVTIVALCAVDGFRSPGFYLIAVTAYVLLVLGARRSSVVQGRLAWLWLR